MRFWIIFKERAQDGRPQGIPGTCAYGGELQGCGVNRPTERASVFLSSLAVRSRALCAYFLPCLLLAAVTVDRLAVTVGSTVITELQIDEDLRVAALMSGKPVERDLDSRRAAADRLVAQLLIQHEIELSQYPPPSDVEVSTLYNEITETLGGSARSKQLLAEYNVTEQTLRAHVRAQLVTLRFIEFRFRPDISISDGEIESAYRRRMAASETPVPALGSAEKAKIAEVLLEEGTDIALNSWLAESRKQVNIVYLDSTLQ
jgi:hypothetical protein